MKRLDALTAEATLQMLHELQVHQIELEMQNEKLRRSRTEVDTSNARYFDFHDLAPVGYISVSEFLTQPETPRSGQASTVGSDTAHPLASRMDANHPAIAARTAP